MDEIVNKLYGTISRERSISELIPGVNSVIQKLKSWLSKLPPSLQLDNKLEGPNVERACLVLHMMYNQVRMFYFVGPSRLLTFASYQFYVLDRCYSLLSSMQLPLDIFPGR